MHEEYYSTDFQRDEEHHWWYRARRKILRSVIRAIALPQGASILEIGIGSGKNLYSIYPEHAKLCGVEPGPELVEAAAQRGTIPVHLGTAEELPPPVDSQHFDAITMLDVLEHTEDDDLVLRGVYERLRSGGVLLLTVPAYMFLWTAHDVAMGHYRRYRMRPLVSLLRRHGFGIERATYFNSLLFLPLALFRIAHRMFATEGEASDTRFGSRGLGQLLYGIFAFERHLLRVLRFPAGVSILVVARKR